MDILQNTLRGGLQQHPPHLQLAALAIILELHHEAPLVILHLGIIKYIRQFCRDSVLINGFQEAPHGAIVGLGLAEAVKGKVVRIQAESQGGLQIAADLIQGVDPWGKAGICAGITCKSCLQKTSFHPGGLLKSTAFFLDGKEWEIRGRKEGRRKGEGGREKEEGQQGKPSLKVSRQRRPLRISRNRQYPLQI